jgi:hypothetical protein
LTLKVYRRGYTPPHAAPEQLRRSRGFTPSQDVEWVARPAVKRVTPKVAEPRRRHFSGKFPVAERGRPLTPVPSTIGSIWLRVTSAGKMATLAIAVDFAGVTEMMVVKVDVPRLEREVSAF